jgi:hypothetical protein
MHREGPVQRAWAAVPPGATFVSSEGDIIEVHNPGVLNTAAGPDFEQAALRINGLLICGAVEIHVKTGEWYAHGHHEDTAYNNVVLHVVGKESGFAPVFNASGKPVPTIIIPLFEASSEKQPVCKPFWSDQLAPALIAQLNAAKRQYFELQLVRIYEAAGPGFAPFNAFRQGFLCETARLLGGSRNGVALKAYARELFTNTAPSTNFTWLARTGRPESGKIRRTAQIVSLHQVLKNTTPKALLSHSPLQSWNHLLALWQVRPGRETLEMLFQLAWLPALYQLGGMLLSRELQSLAIDTFQQSDHPVPGFIAEQWTAAGVPVRRNTALVFQHKYYCEKDRCTECGIFKALVAPKQSF